MFLLKFAAAVSACVTVTLNAHHAFASTSVMVYAVLFAVLNGALDLAKCTCLVAAANAFQARRPMTGAMLVALFFPLLANSLWCGLSEVTISRAADKGAAVARQEARLRAEDEHRRLKDALSLIEDHPLYRATAACADIQGPDATAFCARRDRAAEAVRAAGSGIDTIDPADPAPHFTVLSSVTGASLPALQFTLALWPVLLAELVGSVGFLLAGRAQTTPRPPTMWWERWRRREAPMAGDRAAARTEPPVETGRLAWPHLARS